VTLYPYCWGHLFIRDSPFWATYSIGPLPSACSVQHLCLSVTLVYCGKMVGWIKMSLGRKVGLGPRHIALDGDPAPPPQRDTAAPNFRHMSVVAKRLDRSRGSEVGLDRPWPHCVRWGSSSPTPKGAQPAPIFGPCLLWLNRRLAIVYAAYSYTSQRM